MTNQAVRKALFGQAEVPVLLTALEDSSDAIVVYSYDKATKSLQITYLNEAFTRQTGYSAQKTVGKNPGDFPGLPGREPAQDRIRAALKKEPAVHLELISYRKDGSDLWNQFLLRPIRDSSGRTSHWLPVERDVSVPFTREQRLQTENFKLTRLIAIARRLSATLDGRELVHRLKAGVRQLTGAEAVLYAPMSDGRFALTEDLEPPALNDKAGDEFIMRAAAGEWNVVDFARTRAAVAVTPTGGTPIFVIEVRARERQVLRESDLSAIQLLAQYVAVPARNVELYAELNALRSSAIELTELKGDLIAMLAHDFNGPLAAIIGFADVLSHESSQSEDDRESLRTIARAATLLTHLAEDTLALSSLERNEVALVLTPVDVVALVRDVALSLRGRGTVRVTTDLETAVIAADERRLRQVFYNIIDNAIKYSQKAPGVNVSIEQKEDKLQIDVIDSGIGIPPAEIKSLFKRFARASNARGLGIAGSGFGLYLVKMILERHGGHVSILDSRKSGTTFRISLPKDLNVANVPTCRVLICEDGTENHSFLAHTLRWGGGFHVSTTTCCDQLFEDLVKNDYDYLVLDVSAVALTDAEIKRLEELSTKKGFEVITISADGHTLSERFGALLKPFLVKDLLAAVKERSPKET